MKTKLSLLLSLFLFVFGCSKGPEYSAEIVSLQKEIEQEPTNWKLHYELVEKFEAEELYAEAIAQTKIMLEANPTEPRIQSQLAHLYLKNKEMETALSTAEKLIQQNPAEGIGYQVLGELHFDRGEYEKAKKNLTKANQLGSWTEESLLNILYKLGMSYYKLKDDEKALSIFKKVLDKNPFHEESLFFLSLHHFKRQEWTQSETYLKRLISKTKTDYRYYLILGLLNYHRSHWTECQEFLRKAFDLDPSVQQLGRIADVANLYEIPADWDLAAVIRFGQEIQYRENGEYVVRGDAINIGFRIAKDSRVLCDFYNDKNELVDDETVYLRPRNLMPMQIRDFRIAVSDDPPIETAKIRFNWRKSSLQYKGRH